MTNESSRIPDNHVLAVLSPTSVEGATKDLEHSGFEDFHVLMGETASQVLDAKGDHSGPLGKMAKAVAGHLSEEPNYRAQYEGEAQKGNVVLAVAVPERDRATDVREVLERHGARNLRYFGTFAVSDLSPESNPSTRSQASPEMDAPGKQ